MRWRGCSVEPTRELRGDAASDSPLAIFRGIHFENCDFRGSAFLNCAFEDCIFERCNLSGGLFGDCLFRNCEFREMGMGMASSTGFFGCRFEKGATFTDCYLVQFTIADGEAGRTQVDEQGIRFSGGVMWSSRFEGIDFNAGGALDLSETENQEDNWFEDENSVVGRLKRKSD